MTKNVFKPFIVFNKTRPMPPSMLIPANEITGCVYKILLLLKAATLSMLSNTENNHFGKTVIKQLNIKMANH